MDELVSRRQLIVFSLLLGLVSTLLLVQAVGIPGTSTPNTTTTTSDGFNSHSTTTTIPSSTVSSTSTTASSTSSATSSSPLPTSTATSSPTSSATSASNSTITAIGSTTQFSTNNAQVRSTTQTTGPEQLAQAKLGFQLNGLELVITSITWLGLSFLILLGISAYLSRLYNMPATIQYINTALRLAGFKQQVGSFGKSWNLQPGMMHLQGVFHPTIKFYLPVLADPLAYGLHMEEESATITCSLASLPVQLLVIRHYLNNDTVPDSAEM